MDKTMKRIGPIFLLLAATSITAGGRLQPVEVAGLSVPGTPDIGRAMGFTECVDKYSYYECKRSKQTIVYGAKADSASIFFDGKDNFSTKVNSSDGPKVAEVPPEKLSYRSVRLEFPLTEREVFENALLADGWLKSGAGNSREYFKEGIPATFKIHRSLTTLNPADLSEVNSQLADLKKKSAEATKAASNSTSFIDAMKK
ncbi:hypothetical protein RG836_00155 [Pseudomonas sp. SZMC_28357]|uniref:hypothetical protein n=1 Tax=Pseudomonas sp. SZMC_28357 TaxID=3074380 RepID=UPI0028715974|nr:hypothetical protein [Pseudomonas sp. SZMC_28357]MDR9749844.1 hypothetical protein [Pseudomonas sp. SZMC_28357]